MQINKHLLCNRQRIEPEKGLFTSVYMITASSSLDEGTALAARISLGNGRIVHTRRAYPGNKPGRHRQVRQAGMKPILAPT